MDKDKLASLPEKPGVYIYRDSGGKVIYVGKAKVLKNRVRSYFSGGKKDLKTQQLAARVADIDFIVTGNELEAFILENNLIKEHKPKYNILLKDDKSYPYIMISMKDSYPGVYITRETKDKTNLYFGPYFSGDAKKVAALIYRIFKVRQCTLELSGKPLKRPCIYYDTGFCSAPCVRYISDADYIGAVSKVRDFLGGNYGGVIEMLKTEMEKLSGERKYEKAAETRDAIRSVGEIMKEQKMVLPEEKDIDIAGFIYRNGAYYFGVFNIRRGRLTGKTINIMKEAAENETPLEIFLSQYYSRNISMADELVLGEGAADGEILRSIVFKGKEIKITFEPPDGRLIRIVGENLDEKASSEEKFDKRKVNIKEEYLAQMKALKESLNLEYMPECIEGIDISHSSGDNMVGSLVVFKNGEPDKKNYRHFNIKTVGQVDDYASINEVVERRYSRLKAEGEYFPDIILGDGGPGQVSAAREGLNRVGVDILLLGLAKEHEEVFRSGQKGPVPVSEKAGFLLMRVRDEAHRFANSLRKKLANRDLKASIFDSIGGIGEKTKYKIYNGFRDFDELAAAIENGDDRASFLNKKQKESVLAAIRGKK